MLSTEASIAIIVSSLALIGTIITFLKSANKDDLDVLRGIIEELKEDARCLKEKVDELEAENSDLKDWAERLVSQVKELGSDPVKFIRHQRQFKDKTRPRPQ